MFHCRVQMRVFSSHSVMGYGNHIPHGTPCPTSRRISRSGESPDSRARGPCYKREGLLDHLPGFQCMAVPRLVHALKQKYGRAMWRARIPKGTNIMFFTASFFTPYSQTTDCQTRS